MGLDGIAGSRRDKVLGYASEADAISHDRVTARPCARDAGMLPNGVAKLLERESMHKGIPLMFCNVSYSGYICCAMVRCSSPACSQLRLDDPQRNCISSCRLTIYSHVRQ
jgi:hypothetical protein